MKGNSYAVAKHVGVGSILFFLFKIGMPTTLEKANPCICVMHYIQGYTNGTMQIVTAAPSISMRVHEEAELWLPHCHSC